LTAPAKLKADDFRQIAPQVVSMISRYGKIRLLIDASGFNGWEDIAAFGNHAGFVKRHQQKVDRIAVIVARDWQRWLIAAVSQPLMGICPTGQCGLHPRRRYTKLEFRDRQHSSRLGLLIG